MTAGNVLDQLPNELSTPAQPDRHRGAQQAVQ
jgi:hypothetical protein